MKINQKIEKIKNELRTKKIQFSIHSIKYKITTQIKNNGIISELIEIEPNEKKLSQILNHIYCDLKKQPTIPTILHQPETPIIPPPTQTYKTEINNKLDIENDVIKIEIKINDELKNLIKPFLCDEIITENGNGFTYKRYKIKNLLGHQLSMRSINCLLFAKELNDNGTMTLNIGIVNSEIVPELKNFSKKLIESIYKINNVNLQNTVIELNVRRS